MSKAYDFEKLLDLSDGNACIAVQGGQAINFADYCTVHERELVECLPSKAQRELREFIEENRELIARALRRNEEIENPGRASAALSLDAYGTIEEFYAAFREAVK